MSIITHNAYACFLAQGCFVCLCAAYILKGMTAINHALTGAAIGLILGNPWVAVPVALLSHFACDALPHYGRTLEGEDLLSSKGFRNYLIVDALLCIALVVILAISRPEHWLLAAACAFIATSPDTLWINRFIKARQGRSWTPSAYARFASVIQWFERPLGGVVEIAWFVALALIILPVFLVE